MPKESKKKSYIFKVARWHKYKINCSFNKAEIDWKKIKIKMSIWYNSKFSFKNKSTFFIHRVHKTNGINYYFLFKKKYFVDRYIALKHTIFWNCIIISMV